MDPVCDVHGGEDKVPAKVICMTHNVLICNICEVMKKHSMWKCDIKEINKLSKLDGKKKDMILLKNEIKRKLDNLKSHESKLDQMVWELKTEVNEVYEKLASHLGTMRQSVLCSIDQQKQVIQQNLRNDMDALAPLKKRASENLQKLKESNVEKTERIMDIMLDIVNNVSERMTVAGKFVSTRMLEDTILKMAELGSVTLAETVEEDYDEIGEENTHISKTKHQNRNSTVSLPDITCASEQNANDAFKQKNNTPSLVSEQYHCSDDYEKPTQDQHDAILDELQHIQCEQSAKPKHYPKYKTRPNIAPKPSRGKVSKNTRYQDTDETVAKLTNTNIDENNVYIPVTFSDQTLPFNATKLLFPPEGLRSKALLSRISSIRSEEMLVFLDLAQGEVFLCDVFGNVTDRTTRKQAVDLATCNDEDVAVLHGLPLQIAVYKSKGKTLNLLSNVDLVMQLSPQEITGFEMHPYLLEYVVMCTSKVVFFDGLGTVKNSIPIEIEESDTEDLYFKYSPLTLSTYDFFQKCVYTVKSSPHRKTYKCYNLADRKRLWRRVCTDEVFDPVAVSLLDDKLLILCKTAVMKINTMTGAAIKPVINITCLPGDALGFCTLKDRKRIVVSTRGETFDQSLTVGYLSDE